MGLGNVAGLRQQQRHRVLGGRDDVRLRGVDHHHAAGRGGVDVDVVEPDPGAADDDQVGSGGEHIGRHLCRRSDDQGVRPHDRLEHLFGRQIGLDVDGVAGRPEPVETALGDRFGDEDARHVFMLIGRGRARQRT
jgi:hypothetical protein